MASESNVKYPVQQTGILDKVVNKLEKAGDVIQGGLEAAGHFLESEWNKHKFGLILNNFVTGYRIQLISKASSHALRIVEHPNGKLVLDGKGEVGEHALNAIWTVVNNGDNQVHLYNNDNFLGIVNGEAVVLKVDVFQGKPVGAEAKLQLVTNGDYLVALQSTVDENKCIGVNNDGTLKSCSSADPSALFGVILIKNTENEQLEEKK
ncbi:uncharacterized protein LOC111126047 isoform X1 [Crassostrea virginica]